MADIYDAKTYEPRKSVGHLLNRVRTAMFAALDQEFATEPELTQYGSLVRAVRCHCLARAR